MAQKKFPIIHRANGFTLLEVLLSITILSTVAIGMFYFFTNAMKYTTYNQGKTVAINIARGVLAYMERLDFTTLKQYVDKELHDSNMPFVKLNASSCNLPLFEEKQVCEALLRPTINNVTYDETRIHVFLIPYNDKEAWDKLKASPPEEFPASLKEEIRNENIENLDTDLQNYLLKIYVIVRWGDRADESEWVEGVIANETIR
ncbi:type IV pilus modification PilV family protein [Saccharococcus thermophilus]|uniref:Prepilin-type N-terminal cleavage/methylation domain-containing protein n=1 Tax=Saccharococcus thermophilus TaxID=29396 RepID=A0A846MJ24_9BACL|nr:prepilin-type N-terminal cleavage/methylation domain-containing protein [Saccharococcus thermophilus]NIK15614.1 prepilin-type N-terminal cleavage/methylation domain-containing protein [Saccharococcus thermophilus]